MVRTGNAIVYEKYSQDYLEEQNNAKKEKDNWLGYMARKIYLSRGMEKKK